jgi:hypothetical protein
MKMIPLPPSARLLLPARLVDPPAGLPHQLHVRGVRLPGDQRDGRGVRAGLLLPRRVSRARAVRRGPVLRGRGAGGAVGAV